MDLYDKMKTYSAMWFCSVYGSDTDFEVFFCFAVAENMVMYHIEIQNWHGYCSLHSGEMLEQRLYAP